MADASTTIPDPLFPISGRLLPWRMAPLKFPWVGGNFYEVERLILPGHLGAFEEITRNLRDSIRDKDAGAMHLFDLRDFARSENSVKRPTSIIVDVLRNDLESLYLENPPSFWKNFARLFVDPDTGPNSRIDIFAPKESDHLGGVRAYWAHFDITDPDAFNWRRVSVLVPLRSRGTHMFILNVCASLSEIRTAEFNEMLSTFAYEPRFLKEIGI